MLADRYEIGNLVEQHERWRCHSLNLIASENRLSPAVRGSLDNDLLQRYGDYTGRDLAARKYRGNRHLQALEAAVGQLASAVFGASEVELRPISGHIAGAAVIMGLTSPGDAVLELGSDGGGHRLAAKLCQAPLVSLDVHFLPFDGDRYNLALPEAIEQIRRTRPRLVILGSSAFLFPHDVRAIAESTREMPDTILAYDASHVFGLIAGGHFQDPLVEGAQVMFGSTHKTLPGPQGGLILSNDREIMDRISTALYPALITNHHPFRIPALGLCLREALEWGRAYADQTVANARALAGELQQRGVPVVTWNGQATQSHTILLQVGTFGAGADIARRLELAGIMTTAMHLPANRSGEGIRIGVQEVTRLGMREPDMAQVADCISTALTQRGAPEDVATRVADIAGTFQTVHYTWMS